MVFLKLTDAKVSGRPYDRRSPIEPLRGWVRTFLWGIEVLNLQHKAKQSFPRQVSTNRWQKTHFQMTAPPARVQSKPPVTATWLNRFVNMTTVFCFRKSKQWEPVVTVYPVLEMPNWVDPTLTGTIDNERSPKLTNRDQSGPRLREWRT